jgi:ABC-2 type transport system ATP-binding protein
VLMAKLGKKQLVLDLAEPLSALPADLGDTPLELSADGLQITYTFDSQGERTGIASLLRRLADHNIAYKDLHTSQSSLEDIFVNLVKAQ